MRKKVLFIEDESDQVVLLKIRFESAGYDFFYSLTGAEGIKKAEEVNPDIILLDLNLPQMNGLEVLKALKSSTPLKKIPVYVITARSDKNLREECKKAGALDIIFKPYDSKELLEKIQKSLEEIYSSHPA
jgi:DNA-binding response OmpR family regulator